MKAGWEIKKLGEVCDILNGLWIGKKEPFINICVIRNTNFTKDCKLNLDDVAYIDVESRHFSTRKLEVGDIIVEKSGGSDKQPVGRVVLFNVESGDYSFSNFTSALRIKSDVNLKSGYLHKCLYAHYLRGETLKLQSQTTGLRNLDMRGYLRLPISIPPLSEQEQIVAKLDLISGVIDKKKQQLKELDSLAQSLFYEMFGNPVENDKGWETAKVIDVVKLQRGYDLPTNDRVQSGSIPVWGSNGIVGYHNISKIDCGIITGRSGTLGTVYSYDKPFFPLNTTLFSIDTHGNDIVYLRFLLNAFDLKRFGTGTGVPTLNRNTFHSEKIINAPLSLQQEFASRIEKIEKQKELIKQSLKDTETLFNSRMDYYFNS